MKDSVLLYEEFYPGFRTGKDIKVIIPCASRGYDTLEFHNW